MELERRKLKIEDEDAVVVKESTSRSRHLFYFLVIQLKRIYMKRQDVQYSSSSTPSYLISFQGMRYV